MTAFRLLLVAALLALPFWVAKMAPVHACSCAALSVADVVATTDLIVVGTAGDVQLADPLPADATVSFTDIQWAISVQEYVKGSGPDRLDVRSKTYVQVVPGKGIQVNPGGDPTCGYAPDVALNYLFFLSRRDDGLYTTGGCAGNQPITADTEASVSAYLDKIREVLREPVALPATGSGPSHNGAPPIVLLAGASALAGVALVANAAFALRRRG